MTPTVLQRLHPWAGVLVAAAAVLAAALVQPVAGHGDQLTLFGRPFGPVCTFLDLTGLPCPSCGMTRSWVWAVRGELALALRYNVAGVALLAILVAYAPVRVWGGGRLGRRGAQMVLVLAMTWGFVWMIGWAVRLAGGWPIP